MSEIRSRLDRLPPEKRALVALRLAEQSAREAGAAGDGPAQPPAVARSDQPFPLLDLQQAYWVGRAGAFEIGTVAAYSYLEIEGTGLGLDRLALAWRRLIERHEMLRAIVRPDGHQVILDGVPPYEIAVLDLRGLDPDAVDVAVRRLREEMSHQVLPSDRWPLFDVRAALLDPDRTRVLVGLDGLVADAWSVCRLLTEWGRLYQDPDTHLHPLGYTFREYVQAAAAQLESDAYRRARDYWQARLPALPPAPELPLARKPASLLRVRFVRRRGRLDAPAWRRLKERAARANLTPTGVLLAAYVETLLVWSRQPRFTVSVPRFNRQPVHPGVGEVVGEFASFTLLEVDGAAPGDFEARAQRLQAQLWRDLDHGLYDGVAVLRDLARVGDGTAPRTIPVVFTAAPQDPTGHDASLDMAARGLGEIVYAINQTPQVWLDNHVHEVDGAVVCDWDTVDALFPEGLPETLLSAYVAFLHRLADGEASWRADRAELARALVPPEQLEQRARVNATSVPLPDRSLPSLFGEQARRCPDQRAVVSDRRTLTYAELDRLVSAWGAVLRRLGVGPDCPVGIVMEKGWEQVVAVLAVLRAGGACLPVDPGVPETRRRYLLRNGEVRLVLTQSWLDADLGWPSEVRRLPVDASDPALDAEAEGAEYQGSDTDLAYVIYTSGSTGQPKGVMITRRAVANAILDTIRRFAVTEADRGLAVTALHHDMAMFDILGLLCAGGTVVMPDATGARDPAHWADLMRRERVTIWNSVPAALEMLLEHAADRPGAIPDSLRLAFVGGDWIPVTLPERLARHAPAVRVVSVGGPTETTLWNICFPVERVEPEWRSIPYGRPMANARYYVLSDVLEDCPTWAAGELFCAGIGLARGYWRDEERTRVKFLVHPRSGERLYRTGDLGRYWPDGTIEFLGRADLQVKIRGHRVELGEIEATLGRHPGVRMAVARLIEQGGRQRLTAYVVPGEPEFPPLVDSLRSFLQERLPEHMVPAAYVVLRELPLGPTGKIDRGALHEPGVGEESGAVPAGAVHSDTAARIARVVGEALGVGLPDPGENLLRLGANSMDMVRIASRLEREFGIRPRIDQLFRLQTIAALAHYYDEHQAPATFETVTEVRADAPLALLARYKVLLDPREREAFKDRQPGVRRDLGGRPFVVLPPSIEAVVRLGYGQRRSHRRFSLRPVPWSAFGRFVGSLGQGSWRGQPKYLYASPGGLYAVQTYVHLKPGRVEGIAAGVYYHDPVLHRLVRLTPDVEIDRSVHIPFINAPIFDEAAFSIFLIAELEAIGPLYGEQSLHFVTLEAGGIAHLLEVVGPQHGIGLCQIGSLEFDRIRPAFAQGPSHLLVHSLVGGAIDETEANVSGSDPEAEQGDVARARRLADRVRRLSQEEAVRLLEAHRPPNGGGSPP